MLYNRYINHFKVVSMFSIQVFEPTGAEVVTFVEPGTSVCWFHAGSMAKTLEFTTPSRYLPTVLEDHEYKEVKQGAGRPSLYVREEGVYMLIMESKSPYAAQFKRWLAYDVLPAIRKTGSFGNVPNSESGGSGFWQLIDGAIARGIDPERAINLKHQYENPGLTASAPQPVQRLPQQSPNQSVLQWVTESIKLPIKTKVSLLYKDYQSFCKDKQIMPVPLIEFSKQTMISLQYQHPHAYFERKRMKSGWHIIG